MDHLRDSAVDLYSRWLASVFVCCAPRARRDARQIDEIPGAGFQDVEPITFHQQPQYIIPPAVQAALETKNSQATPSRRRTRSSVRASEWASRSRSLALRASTRGSMIVRRRANTSSSRRRLVIGGPTDFRKVDGVEAQMYSFRPLELSIYLPQNKLSPLPLFSPDDEYSSDEDDDFCPAELRHPPQAAHIRQRTASVLSLTPSDFKIPRKPVPSVQGFSIYEHFRHSIDNRSNPSTSNTEWTLQPLRSRPSLPVSPSTQDLLNALQQRLPVEPSSLRTRSNTAPSSALQRSSFAAVSRIQSALEEKEELDATLAQISKKLSLRKKSIQLTIEPSEEADEEVLAAKEPSLRRALSSHPPEPRKLVRAATFSAVSSFAPQNTSTKSTPLPSMTFPSLPPPPPPPVSLPSAISSIKPKSTKSTTETSAFDRQSSFRRVTRWLFPSPPLGSSNTAQSSPPLPLSVSTFYQCKTPAAMVPFADQAAASDSVSASASPSLRSSWSSVFDPAQAPQTLTPQSSPGRETPVRTRTFGHADKRSVSISGATAYEADFVAEKEKGLGLEREMKPVGMAF